MTFDVSVIVPTYNRADLIPDTLDSILSQTYPAAEIVVVDDGSTDDTEAVVRSYGTAVKYMRIDNSGECCARNAGVLLSSQPWLAFCDSDDLWREDKLMLQKRLVDQAPDIEYGFSNFCLVRDGVWSTTTKFDDAPTGYWDVPKRELEEGLSVIDTSFFAKLLTFQPVFLSTLVMKRSFFDRIGRFEGPLGRTRSTDLEFDLRCVVEPPLGVVAEPVVGIRKHGSNISGDVLFTLMGEIEILLYVLEHHPAAPQNRVLIEDEIIVRSAQAAELAFLRGELKLVHKLSEAVPRHRRTGKLWMKSAIAGLPWPVAPLFAEAALFLARRLRTSER